jgi:hypothetical protein
VCTLCHGLAFNKISFSGSSIGWSNYTVQLLQRWLARDNIVPRNNIVPFMHPPTAVTSHRLKTIRATASSSAWFAAVLLRDQQCIPLDVIRRAQALIRGSATAGHWRGSGSIMAPRMYPGKYLSMPHALCASSQYHPSRPGCSPGCTLDKRVVSCTILQTQSILNADSRVINLSPLDVLQ